MLREHCFHRQYVIVPYGTIFEGADTKGLNNDFLKNYVHKRILQILFPCSCYDPLPEGKQESYDDAQ